MIHPQQFGPLTDKGRKIIVEILAQQMSTILPLRSVPPRGIAEYGNI